MIHVGVAHPVWPCKWLLTCAYGPPNYANDKEFWELLLMMHTQLNDDESWVIVGDLNEVLKSDAKLRANLQVPQVGTFQKNLC